ncbi:MAG: hypothetical protein II822_02555 [Prevotella sp.]|nr:hypothetical protein [Prevotella sp.]
MRKLTLFFVLMLAMTAGAQKRAVSILGDSYSTFKDFVVPDTNFVWYPRDSVKHNDVTDVRQTWWHQFVRQGNFRLCQNNSFSGATICNTGYKGEDYSDRSYVTRARYLGSPEVIIVFGGTNDTWAKSPVGEYKYGDWTPQDLYSFRPAMACLLSSLQDRYPGAEVYVVINDILSKEITASMQVISDYYGVRWILLHDIDKQWGHPSQKGMTQIAEQLSEVIK